MPVHLIQCLATGLIMAPTGSGAAAGKQEEDEGLAPRRNNYIAEGVA